MLPEFRSLFPSFLKLSMLVELQVMETFKMTLGADHRDTLTSMGNLAFTWKDQGRHTAVEFWISPGPSSLSQSVKRSKMGVKRIADPG